MSENWRSVIPFCFAEVAAHLAGISARFAVIPARFATPVRFSAMRLSAIGSYLTARRR